ncbi:MAG TPA: glutamate racemase [Candidatus Obscuribacterales bacterium]
MAPAESSTPIRFGLFDSGLGGLSVLRRLHQLASACQSRTFEFVYLGDTARCPYGNREPAEIREFLLQIISFLANQGVDHLVMACNTSAAIGVDFARQVSPVPIHDLISPTAKFVASRFRRIGVMATQSTVNSAAFSRQINYHAPEAQLLEIACPKLVPLVEAGEVYGDHVKAALMEYSSKLEEFEVEAIILGCTHFPFLARALRDLLPDTVQLIDPAEMLVRQLVSDLGLNVPVEQTEEPVAFLHPTHPGVFYTTGSPTTFAQTASICLGKDHASLVPSSDVQLLPLELLRSVATMDADRPDFGLPSNVVPMPPAKATPDSKIVAP